MNSDDNLIPSIYNYCDRWCERCEFTARCSLFESEQELPDEVKDISSEAFVRDLKNIFAQAREMILAKAEEFGIEIEPVSDEEFARTRERKRTFIQGEEIHTVSR